jgi:hypothetical protein
MYGNRGTSLIGWLSWYGPAYVDGFDFPASWLSASKRQRADMAAAIPPRGLTIVPIKEVVARIRELLQRATDLGRNPADWIDEFLSGDGQVGANPFRNWPAPSPYILRVNFSMAGSEAIVRDLDDWVRREAKRFRRRVVAKAGVPPFHCLKWLSAWRLDVARRRDSISFSEVQSFLARYQERGHSDNKNDVLPIYGGHAAWSKAKSDAAKMLRICKSNPRRFEKEVFLF